MDDRVLDIIDRLNEHGRWALGIATMLALYEDTSGDARDAADCAASHLRDMRRLLRELSGIYEDEAGAGA